HRVTGCQPARAYGVLRAAQTGPGQPRDQLLGRDRDGTGGEGGLVVIGGQVVVVAVEGDPRDPEPLGEGVQLLVGGVADQVRPPASPRRDRRRVDEDHGDLTAVTGRGRRPRRPAAGARSGPARRRRRPSPSRRGGPAGRGGTG